MRFVTYSRNIFIPVTDLCSNRCGYCSFRRDTKQAKVIGRAQALGMIEQGAKAGCSEALFSMGQRPEKVEGFRGLMAEVGISSLIDYLIELCELALERGLLPHTNAGILPFKELKRLAPYNASMGLMLETTARVAAHALSPAKKPEKRLSYIALAGRLKIPFTTGILIGIGESLEDRAASLHAIADLHRAGHHIQEVIVQPLDPKDGTPLSEVPRPSQEEMQEAVRLARTILPRSVAIQVPPNLVDSRRMVAAGADDLGGISPVTPDWINPKRPWPALEALRLEGCSLRERLPIYPRYIFKGFYGKKTGDVVKALSGPDGLRRREHVKGEGS